MPTWLIYSLISLFCFGLWGIFSKLSSLHLPASHAIIYESAGITLVGLILLLNHQFKLETNTLGIIYSVLMGISGITGTLLLILAIKNGNTAVVTFMTALYPCLVLVFSFFILKEPINLQHGIGIIFALISILLFTL
jgi:transporter family protein